MNTFNQYNFRLLISNGYRFLFPLLLLFNTSCEEFINVDPPETQLTGVSVFANEATAVSALTGIYGQMMQTTNSLFNGSVTFYAGLSSDELITVPSNQSYNEIFSNNIKPANANMEVLWSAAYSYIYQANAVMEGVNASATIPASVKSQLTGEALFIRAFTHFYLLNFFGEIPVILTTDYRQNTNVKKSEIQAVYAQISEDLAKAAELLGTIDQTGRRVRPNRWAVNALQARVALYTQDWTSAEKHSAALIGNTLYNVVSDPDKVFLPGSQEVIWQLMPVSPGVTNTGEGYMFVQSTGLPVFGSLSQTLVESFEPGDRRKESWITSYSEGSNTFYYPYKYKVQESAPFKEYYVVFRLAEQYLIRAEALVHLNRTSEAITMIDVIRERAGLPLLAQQHPSASADELLIAIMNERRMELMAEWGHRWFDLKRTGKANEVLAAKPNWQSADQLYPIPQKQIQNDPAMANAQNPGY